ncbi:MAG: CopG family transcriptional regulator [Edaphobacter sp.]|jgi:hypothetical protein|uniref:ribbon-helix-helix domain-containing protein n=1 Tax=Terracidiphilus sp. TaxID=1964191 RepID=UPI003C1882A4
MRKSWPQTHRNGELWCYIIYVQGDQVIRGAKRKEKVTVSPDGPPVRATISFPPDLYEAIETIAIQKKVSLAWVVRDAVEQYVADKWPLFKGKT